ncbi:MAG TPA: hypothetical protein VGE62_02035 [Candidatus Paceibacterota bacterium]
MKLTGSLVFYIGNSVVKGAIVTHEKGKVPKILTSRIRELPRYHERDRDHLESKILQEFEALLKDVKSVDFLHASNAKIKIENACVMLSSPWYVSETSVIKIREQKPFVVTEQMIQNAKENIAKAYRDSHKVDVSVLEQKIIRISLNGYPTFEPLKKKAQSLDMNVFTSFARHSSIEQMKALIDKHFHVKMIDVHSQSLMAFSIISDSWKENSQYIIADITSELTELVAVRKGIISEASSFPKGKRFLERTIATELGLTPEVAESLLKMRNNGQIEPELKAKVDGALEKARKEWLSQLTEALSVMSASSSLPSTFYVFPARNVGRIFTDYIMSEEYQQFAFAEGEFKVIEVKVTDFAEHCAVAQGILPDLTLMLGSVFNNKILHAKM